MSRREINIRTGEISTHEDAPVIPIPQKTPAEIEAGKIKQVDAELGKDNIRIIIETILPMLQDGSINTTTADDILIAAKSKRKDEL